MGVKGLLTNSKLASISFIYFTANDEIVLVESSCILVVVDSVFLSDF